ncbi:MAG: hypothetical protein AAB250_11135, partial [Bdellovibrionota bacterium]
KSCHLVATKMPPGIVISGYAKLFSVRSERRNPLNPYDSGFSYLLAIWADSEKEDGGGRGI